MNILFLQVFIKLYSQAIFQTNSLHFGRIVTWVVGCINVVKSQTRTIFIEDFLEGQLSSPKSVTLLEKNLNSWADLACVPVVSGEAAVAEHILQWRLLCRVGHGTQGHCGVHNWLNGNLGHRGRDGGVCPILWKSLSDLGGQCSHKKYISRLFGYGHINQNGN